MLPSTRARKIGASVVTSRRHEPVVDEILVGGIPIIDTMPRVKSGAA